MTSPGTQYRTLPNHKIVNLLPEASQVLLATLFWHRNAVTGQCNPRHDTLARELGWSYSRVRDNVRVLREAGILRAIKGRRGNQYDIRPTQEWRKPEIPKRCRPRMANCDQPESVRQEAAVLTEREALFLKERVAAVPTVLGDGGSPAALSAQKTEKPAPPRPRPNPIPPAKPRPAARCTEPPLLPVLPPDLRVNKPGILCAEYSEEAGKLVGELLPQHPVAGNPAGAVKAIAKVLQEGATTETIRQSHARYRRLWAHFRPGRFIPQLWRWIADNDWRYPPDDKAIESARGPVEEDAEERKKRVFAILAQQEGRVA